ncbi:MAG: DNA-binding protein [Planctomycetaceae bacterium]|nr:DNA-binding protein [Planctomycetaceae bacterium]
MRSPAVTPIDLGDDRYVTVAFAASYLSMSRSAVYEAMDGGRLTYARIPGKGTQCMRRIKLSVLRKFAEDATVFAG